EGSRAGGGAAGVLGAVRGVDGEVHGAPELDGVGFVGVVQARAEWPELGPPVRARRPAPELPSAPATGRVDHAPQAALGGLERGTRGCLELGAGELAAEAAGEQGLLPGPDDGAVVVGGSEE